MLVSEIYEDARGVLGKCNEELVFRRLTEAVRLLARKARWDSTLAEIDICVNRGYVTLPAECKTVLGVLSNGQPTHFTDSWFSYHLNGPGSTQCAAVGYTRLKGTYPTINDPSAPVYLVAELQSAQDNNSLIRVFGFKQDGTEVYTPNPTTGVMEPGALVPTVFGYPVPLLDAPQFARITRVQKAVTSGFVRLLAINPSDLSSHTLIGYYGPNETDPQYQRLQVGQYSWVRVRYQKKDDVIRSQNDWLNLSDPMSLMMALKSVRFRYEDKSDEADKFEATASRLMSEEQKSLQPNSVLVPQIINGDSWNTAEQEDEMFYGGNCGNF